MVEMFNPTDSLEMLAASASEIHAAGERGKLSLKLRVEFKSEEDRVRKRQTRLLKNRQSAALSRQRKKEYITDLEERTNGLISENHELMQKVAKLSSVNVDFKLHIDSLEKCLNETKNENLELRSRLASMTGTSPSSSSSSLSSSSSSSPSSITTTTTTTTTTITTQTNSPPPDEASLTASPSFPVKLSPSSP